MIISISGTPKTGKTAVAKALARKLGWGLVSLNELAAEKKLYLGYDRSRKSRIVDIRRLKAEIRRIIKAQEKLEGVKWKEGDKGRLRVFKRLRSRNLIIESHYSHDMPCDAIVILHANPGELRARMRKVGWTKKKIEENVEAEIMEVVRGEALGKAKRILEMDTTGRRPEWVAGQIVRKLRL